MRSNAIAFFLLLAMVWQSLAWLSPSVLQAQAEQLAHLSVHVHDADHHHDVDESLQTAPEGDNGVHFHADNGFQPVGLTASTADTAVLPMTSTLPGTAVSKPIAVFIDGLLRPPSLNA